MFAGVFDILGPSALASAPPPLPAPPALQQWLFERPVLAGLALAAFAAAGFLILNRQGKGSRAVLVGGVLLGLAAVIAVTGLLVETTHERLTRLSNQLVDAVAEGRTADARAMLADDLVVAFGSMTLPGGGVVDRAEQYRAGVRVTEHFVTDESASVGTPATSGASQFLVRATTDAGFVAAWVRLNWREEPDGAWRVYLLEVLRVNGQDPDGVAGLGLFGR